jgi:hypothetical protein
MESKWTPARTPSARGLTTNRCGMSAIGASRPVRNVSFTTARNDLPEVRIARLRPAATSSSIVSVVRTGTS